MKFTKSDSRRVVPSVLPTDDRNYAQLGEILRAAGDKEVSEGLDMHEEL